MKIENYEQFKQMCNRLFKSMLEVYENDPLKVIDVIIEQLIPAFAEFDGTYRFMNKVISIVYNVPESELKLKHLNDFTEDVLGMPSLMPTITDFLQFHENKDEDEADNFVFLSEINID